MNTNQQKGEVNMRCEYCKKMICQGDIAHGIRYGTVDVFKEIFLPAQDSAFTVICESCGNLLCKLIYAKLNINPAIYKTFSKIR